GTPRAVIEPQRDVAVWTWDIASEAFGNSAPNADPDGDSTAFVLDMRFPGQRYDAASGLNYNYFRDYEAGVGRYSQSDPIGLAGGVSTYVYVQSSPLMSADRLGLRGEGAAIGCAVGGGVGSTVGASAGGLAGGSAGLTCGPGAVACSPAAAAAAGTAGWAFGGAVGCAVGGYVGNAIQNLWSSSKRKPSREQKPEDCPAGTKPIDQVPGLSSEDIHRIKDGVSAGPRDWVGISPDGNVWINEGGEASDQGHFGDYLP
ncbi:type IV secretion protein Rhs, partial [Lysobacter maris]